VANGHQVVATTRSTDKLEALRATGAEPAVLDVLDRDAVTGTVVRARPNAVVHEATALSAASLGNLRKFDDEFTPTNRLRAEGTDNLLAAVRSANASRFVVQSFAGWPYAREGGPAKTEEDPLDPNPPKSMRRTLAAIRHLEATVLGADGIEGIVLRYGGFYGPDTGISLSADHVGAQVEAIRKRRFPVIGNGAGVWSFVHIDDAAAATATAIEHATPGIYNIVDDDPAPVAELLPALAAAVGAKPPRRVPAWLGRLLAGETAISMMTQVRGASNAKAKRQLGWQPRHPSWRRGFVEGLS
jgi:nucleoside-diphosphate-sugar epimerase